ncbi:MAG: hypothetical protein ACI9UT_000504 [Flavobacteriales bacterium]|jgi:hypothetical protein
MPSSGCPFYQSSRPWQYPVGHRKRDGVVNVARQIQIGFWHVKMALDHYYAFRDFHRGTKHNIFDN